MARVKRTEVARIVRKGYWRETDAQVVVGAWRESGEPKSRFARRYDLDVSRLTRWSKRLSVAQPDTPRFHPVRLTGRGDSSTAAGPIELVLGREPRILLPSGFDSEELRRILVVLAETASC